MSLFAIADLHLSLSTDKSMEVFYGWNDYSNRIFTNWKRLISDDDTVVIVGDISWALKLDECYQDFKAINELPGKKIFIKGNHDLWWNTKKKLEDYLILNNFDTISILFNNSYLIEDIAISGSRGWYFDNETEEDANKVILRECGRIQTSINSAKDIGKTPVVFLHYPPVMRDRKCEEIMSVLHSNDIKECYYGHLHGSAKHNAAITGLYEGINFHLISADYVDFTPVPIKINNYI